MRQYTDGNSLIKYGTILVDFLIVNLLVVVFFYWNPDHIVPKFFVGKGRMVLVVINMALLIAEMPYHTILHQRFVSFFQSARRVIYLTLTNIIIAFVIFRFINSTGGMWRFMLWFGGCELVLMVISRAIEIAVVRNLRRLGFNSRSVLLVGNDPSLLNVFKRMTSLPSRGYNVVGYFADSEFVDCPEELKHLGSIADFNRAIKQLDEDPLKVTNLDELFCSMSHDFNIEIESIMRFCDKNVIRFYYVPRQFGNYALNLKPERFDDMVMFTNHFAPLDSIANKILKRTFDIIFSLIVCICLLPFVPIIALIIKIQSPGPLFFIQERTGIDGKSFKCIKFRSMHVNKNADSVQATKNDPRKFPFGNFMRKSNIDELPQFFNVLMGQMSVVGPRPHMLMHTEMYGKIIDQYMVRHFAKPGITGWAQVTGYRGETKELWQMEERVKRDIWYIENWSFWLDIKIIFMTIKSVFVHDQHAY